MVKKFLTDVRGGITPETWWSRDFADDNKIAKYESKDIYMGDSFDTPKPERLLQRIILHKVIDGEDLGGISKAVNWQGGGGFRYYKLAPSLIVDDPWGNQIINPAYNAAQLAEALCKLEGFSYAPSEVHWWQQDHSSERDFIYVTTQNLSVMQLQALADEVGGGQSLLVCCSAFRGITADKAAERWPNLTLKKIPKMVLARCEWGQDDYSLNVANLPMAKPDAGEAAPAKGKKKMAA